MTFMDFLLLLPPHPPLTAVGSIATEGYRVAWFVVILTLAIGTVPLSRWANFWRLDIHELVARVFSGSFVGILIL